MPILAGHPSWPSILLARANAPDAATDIEAAERAGAWTAWRQAAATLTPEQVFRLVATSGLRGRGGAGHPTGAKWQACAASPSRVRHVVANGFESDPGAQLDRTLMETDPHAVVEGVTLAAYAVRATTAIIAVNARYTTAIERLRGAIEAAESKGYLGANAMGTGTQLRIEVRPLSAPSCWVRRPCCCGRSRIAGHSPTSDHRTPPRRVCGASRPWSTTSRRSPPCPGSWPMAPVPTPPSAAPMRQGRRSSS